MMAKAKKKYKLKTHKATAKRFRVTKSGKIMRMQGGKSHFRRKKAKRVKYKFRQNIQVTAKGDRKRVQRLAPYLKLYKSNPPK
jgi:large subunit ribosomal protein L35